MPLTESFDKAVVSGALWPYRVKIDIRADDGTWCEISKDNRSTFNDPWFNRLLRRPVVDMKSEGRPGRFAPAIKRGITFRDDDQLFAGESWTLYDSSGVTHDLTTWYRAWLRVQIGHHVESPDEWTYTSLGIFIIKDVLRNRKKVANFVLGGLQEILIKTQANDMKRGDAAPVNIPATEYVKKLVEFGSAGVLTVNSSIPATVNLDTTERVISVMGNVPVRDPSTNEWNEDQDFVTRYMLRRGNLVYHLGYTRVNNAPAICSHNEVTDAWTAPVEFDTELGGKGWEIVYGHVGEGIWEAKLFLYAIRNESSSSNEENHQLKIFRVGVAGLTFETLNATSEAWIPNKLVHRPITFSDTEVYGRLEVVTISGKYNPAFFFPSVFGAPGHSGTAAADNMQFRASNPNSSTGAVEPERGIDIRESVNFTATHSAIWHTPLNPGYYTLFRDTNNFVAPPLYTYTHGAAYESFRYDAKRNKVFWCYWDGAAAVWKVLAFDPSGGTLDAARELGFTGSNLFYTRNITAICPAARTSETGTFWVAAIDISDAEPDSGVLPQSRVWRFDFSSSGTMTPHGGHPYIEFAPASQDTFDEDARFCPVFITIRANGDAGLEVWGQVVNWFAVNTNCYGFWWDERGAGTPATTGIYTNNLGAGTHEGALPISTSPFAVSDTIRPDSRQAYIQDQATGALYFGNPRQGFTPISEGQPADGESTWASSNLLTGADQSIYSVSAPGPPASVRTLWHDNGGWGASDPPLGINTPAGRHSAWRYALGLLGVLRVADPGPVHCWDALEEVRFYAGPDYVVYPNADGEIVFAQRGSATPTITIRHPEDGYVKRDWTMIPAMDIESSRDPRSIANSITIPIYKGERAAPDIDMVISSDSKAFELVPYATQMNNRAQRVVLTCINAASLADSTGDIPLLFGWRRTQDDISTALKSAALVTVSNITVYGLYTTADGSTRLGDLDIAAGDTLQIGDSDFVRITSITPATDTINLATAIGGSGTHAVGSTVRIRPQDRNSAGDSLDGVCVVTAAFDQSGQSSKVLTVDSTARLSPGMVLSRITESVVVLEVLTSTTVRVKTGVLGSGAGQYFGGAFTWGPNTVLRGAIWFAEGGKAYRISDTGIAVSISAPSDNVYANSRFEVGDRIIITCSGLKNRKMEHAVYRAVNSESIARYEKHDYKFAVENRFMDNERAKVILENADSLAWPVWSTKTPCPLMIDQSVLGPGNTLYVQDSHLWPDFDDNKVAHTITGWVIDTDKGRMELMLQSKTPISEAAVGAPRGGAWVKHGKETGYPS